MDREQDTIRTGVIREAVMFIARLWAQHFRPVAFDRIFYVDGVRVRVIIDEYKGQ